MHIKICFLLLILMAFNCHAQSLRDVSGQVEVKDAKTQALTKAANGQHINTLDTVIAGPDGRCTVQLLDLNSVEIYSGTTFQIEAYENDPTLNKKSALLKLIDGRVRAKVREKYKGDHQSFVMHTPAAVAGVRGTDFILQYNAENKRSSLVTLEGTVQFGLPGPGPTTILKGVRVSAGSKSIAEAGKPPRNPVHINPKIIERLRKGEITEVFQETKTNHSTEKRAHKKAR